MVDLSMVMLVYQRVMSTPDETKPWFINVY